MRRKRTYKLTVRHGSQVRRESYASADAAVLALREHAEEVQHEGGLEEVSAFRTYAPDQRVEARLEISGGGLLRSQDAGIDVMGDGSIMPFRGGVFRRPLALNDGEDVYLAIAETLRGDDDG